MKIHFLGTCAGTEPMPGRHHTAFIIETADSFYQFDAGESCAYTAYATMKLDMLKLRAMFFTHPHIDHYGGLPHLLYTVAKLCVMRKCKPGFDPINVVISDKSVWDAAYKLGVYDGKTIFGENVHYNVNCCSDGVVYSDENIKVEALHNMHLGVPEDGCWKSYSYRVTCEGKTVILSGDIRSIDDIDVFLADGCDALLIETGHHHPADVAATLKERAYSIGHLFYVHSGRRILNEYEESYRAIAEIWKDGFTIAEDATTAVL